uniref:Late embryogenesis abundant protein LEA-2 subgroup domain-containing protein n=1 Tax=Rhizophora mucronata TaxID=61149 RepID=A0A2P2J089_RHIMU
MAEQQKIHPVSDRDRDVETAHPPPTAPLVPPGTSKSDTADPTPGEIYPPFRRTLPVMHSKPPKKRSCLCRCFCWTAGLLLLLIVIIGIVAGILFLVFQPKFPKYSIDRMQVTQFILNPDSSLYATFNVTISARNPNKKIGIYYEGGSYINVWYEDTKLCEGSLPKFYQGHRKTTVLNVPLTGQTQDANSLFQALQQQQQQTGTIPMDLKVKQPVRVKLGKLKLMKVKFLVRCRLNVNSLTSNNSVTIRNSSCKIRFRL